MEEVKEKGKIRKLLDMQISLEKVLTYVVGLGGTIFGIGGTLLFLGNLLYVEKKEFVEHRIANEKVAVMADEASKTSAEASKTNAELVEVIKELNKNLVNKNSVKAIASAK